MFIEGGLRVANDVNRGTTYDLHVGIVGLMARRFCRLRLMLMLKLVLLKVLELAVREDERGVRLGGYLR